MNNTENPTLIAGFEDVMSYIKNQDARIKSLEKENKKLKLEDDQMEDTLSSLNFYKEVNEELKGEHTQYRMDIDELKDKLNLCKASHTRITEKNKELKEEFKELVAEIEDMKQQYYTETGENWRSD